MTTPPKPIEDTQAIPADIMETANASYVSYLEALESVWSPTAGDRKKLAVECVAKAILSERQRDEWQLIETAPHETNVLLAWLDSSFTGQWVMEAGMASWGWRRGGVSNMSRHGQATHWKHLPSPPKTDNQKGNNRFSRKWE